MVPDYKSARGLQELIGFGGNRVLNPFNLLTSRWACMCITVEDYRSAWGLQDLMGLGGNRALNRFNLLGGLVG
jgi:hypothetical protein